MGKIDEELAGKIIKNAEIDKNKKSIILDFSTGSRLCIRLTEDFDMDVEYLSSHQVDMFNIQLSIDKIVRERGTEILKTLSQDGVIVEGEFDFNRGILERNLVYLENKLSEIGLMILINHEADESEIGLPRLITGYYPGTDSSIDYNHFYYVYRNGFLANNKDEDKKRAEEVALEKFCEINGY
ncbi:hypothetical protein [Paenibacillus sp. FSL M7-0896]|uniref:hypothetical protein n=1 Tax=Paenibacillus sp. FSL M7-0896 TaxID=2921610 RepID=UPI0030DC9132